MHTLINGQSVDCAIAFGLAHQVVRTYEAYTFKGHGHPEGDSGYVDDPYWLMNPLPWFREFRDAVNYLESMPWTGLVRSYIMREDGRGPSSMTAGEHYIKQGGDPRHPRMAPFKSTTRGEYCVDYFGSPEAAERHRAQFGGEVVQTSPDNHGRYGGLQGIWRVDRRIEA